MKLPSSNRFTLISIGCLVLGGCADLPRDQSGWTAQIQQDRVLVVGFSRPSQKDELVFQREKAVLQKLAKRLGARLEMREGNAHTLLDKLGKREIAVVMAQIPSESPFAEKLGFSQPFYKRDDGNNNEVEYSIAVAPGENRLLLMLDKTIADDKTTAKSVAKNEVAR